MIEAKTFLYRVLGGGDFYEILMKFEMGERLTRLRFGIKRLEEICRIARGADSTERETLRERLLTLFCPAPLAMRWAGENGVSGLGKSISQLADEIRDWSRTSERLGILEEFAYRAVEGASAPTDLLVELCNSHTSGIGCLKILAEGLFDSDLVEPSVHLIPSGSDRFLELSLRPKGLSPEVFLLELESDMGILRKNEDQETRRNSIVAYSWLLDIRKQKTAKILDRLGLGMADGSKIVMFDPNENMIAADECERRKVALAALTAIPLATINLERFLRHGRLPYIGKLEIAAGDFWK